MLSIKVEEIFVTLVGVLIDGIILCCIRKSMSVFTFLSVEVFQKIKVKISHHEGIFILLFVHKLFKMFFKYFKFTAGCL